MKKTLPCIAIFAMFASLANAATTVNVKNFDFPPSAENGLTIVDNVGNAVLTNLAFGVGSFGAGGYASAEDIKANFNVLATGSTGAFAHFDVNTTVNTSPQDDSPVYVVIYDGADLASSTDYIVVEGNNTFKAEDPVLNTASSPVQLHNGDVVYGTLVENVDTSGLPRAPFRAFTNGVTFGAGEVVPEPSTALLSLIGLGFVARRRR